MNGFLNPSEDGEFMFNRFCGRCNCNKQHQYDPCCPRPVVEPTCVECGLTVESVSDVNITSVCSRVTYTVTITNNGDMTAHNAVLTVPLDGVLAIVSSSVTVNGQTVEVENLDQIPLGDIEEGGTVTVTYTVVVMEYKRYIYTRALVTFCACCCFERRVISVGSNLNLLQVCRCCGTNTTATGA